MQPHNSLTDNDVAYWRNDDNVAQAAPVLYKGDGEGIADCMAVQTVMKDGQVVVRVAWKPNEIDLAHLAKGGMIWMSTWGGLPPHMMEVSEP